MGNRTSQRRAAGRSRRRWRRSAVGVNHRRMAWLAGADAVQPVRRANRREDRLSETLHCDPTVAQLADRSENRAAGTGEGPHGVLASRSGVALELAVTAHGTTATPARRHGHDRNRLERGGMARHLHPWAAHWRQHHPRRPSRSRHLGRLCTHASVPHPLQPAGTRRFRPESAIKRTITRQLPTSRTWVTRLTSSCTGVVPLQRLGPKW